MIFETPPWSDGQTAQADLCIIGGGIVGLAIAQSFVGTRTRVLVLEGGGTHPNVRSQDDLWTEPAGATNHAFTFSRFRAYGGNSAYWAGLCPRLESEDFTGRGARPAWPLTPDALDPWLTRAETLLGVPAPATDLPYWQNRMGTAPDLGPDLRPVILPLAKNRNFGLVQQDALRAAPNIQVVLNGHVVEIETDPTAQQVTGVKVALPGNRHVQCRAAHYVLAAGGVENARLLLLSDRHAKTGLGNGHDQVGRVFMDHIYCYAGHLEPSGPGNAKGPHIVENFADLPKTRGGIAAYALHPSLLQQEGLNGAAAFFMHRCAFQLHPDYDSPGGAAVTYAAELLRRERFADRAALGQLAALIRHMPAAARLCLRHAAHSLRPQTRIGLRMQIEASPRPDSRVTLTPKRDRWGRRRARVDWQLGPQDGAGAARLWGTIAQSVRDRGIGTLVGTPPGQDGVWPASTTGGKHHMGTTRMSNDPAQGVVTPDARVHGTKNLHIAGSSVFPTGSWANPTLTAVALALRLADRLKNA